MVFIASHIEVDSVSRARRALSRAAARVAAMEALEVVSYARTRSTSAVSIAVAVSSGSTSTPMIESRVRQVVSSSTPGSSRISWVCTSRIRAVSSARST